MILSGPTEGIFSHWLRESAEKIWAGIATCRELEMRAFRAIDRCTSLHDPVA